MQKVITVVTALHSAIHDGAQISENQYPELNQLLQDGYIIEQVIPHENTQGVACLTFILDNTEETIDGGDY